jgi:hypothetical protein
LSRKWNPLFEARKAKKSRPLALLSSRGSGSVQALPEARNHTRREIGRFVPTSLLKNVKQEKSELGGLGLFAEQDVRQGEAVLEFGGVLERRRKGHDRYAMRIGNRLFLSNSHGVDNYINHSCEPACFIDFDRLQLVAMRDVKAGEELTFHYCTSEYKISPEFQFECRCGSENCVKVVKGFFHLSEKEKQRLAPVLSPFLHDRLKTTHRKRRGSR